ncbi:MAG: hypothetical protein NDJ89_10055 [Oligoflexia bacterium]|nr:hypothetical protein [Oligoflexia bacterium]
MKKRLLLLLVFGVTFSPAVFAEGLGPRNGEARMSELPPQAFCGMRDTLKNLPSEASGKSVEHGHEKSQGATRAN